MAPRLAVALLLVLAGCSGVPGEPPDQRTSAGTTDRPDPPTGTPIGTDTPTGATEANTIDYAALSATEKRAFDAAVEDGAHFFEDTSHLEGEYFDPEEIHTFGAHEFVRKNGTYYRPSVQMGHVVASYGIHATEARPPENATVRSIESLPARSREPVRWAIENGSYAVPSGTWSAVPDGLSGVDYVRHSNTTYRLGVVVGDSWTEAVHAERFG